VYDYTIKYLINSVTVIGIYVGKNPEPQRPMERRWSPV